MLVYDKKNIRAKVRDFNGMIKINFWGDEVQKVMYITLVQPV